MKIVTVVGTRPELIRLSMVIKKLEKYSDHVLVHTGQNYDFELNEIFYKDLCLKEPSYYLGIKNTSIGNAYGEILIKCEEVFIKEAPDAILILGDTNSSISALIAKRMKIPIYHMEAGNRCFDENVPEETNRKIIDHISDFNLVYTEHARRNLLSEGLHSRFIYLTGSPMLEVINEYKSKIFGSDILSKSDINEKEYFLVSLHREENVDNKDRLIKTLNCLSKLSIEYNKKIIFSLHPRTKKEIKKLNYKNNFIFHKPFSFTEYCKLQTESYCTISDSGTISEESSILKFPAITVRNSIERPEAMDTGSISITGFDYSVIKNMINIEVESNGKILPNDYNIDNTSERVLKLIMGTYSLKNNWKGIS